MPTSLFQGQMRFYKHNLNYGCHSMKWNNVPYSRLILRGENSVFVDFALSLKF